VIHLARLVQFASALLLAYGTSYGPRLNNLVFVYGAALVALMTIAIFSRERNWLRAIWPAVLGFALLFVISGFPVLGRPDCETVGSGVACASATAHVIAIAAIALMGTALVAAVVDWRRSSITTA
jgi:hypothetical protein